ncbi:tyrosine-type recombinase/integrase [Pseudomonas sp. CBSPBW29]|uniref:tyrosine-type recombinase/integrase n=1 Tax=Pseudomonas sp. CBS TaxID=2971912 RepID=UPI0021ABC37F|nr:site-specific integrase [Pseudomonas sp. CBS]WEL41789.1 tyrosine-type recombinase/integrase [Pseudomonas sp. CBSPBW29]WEL62853.1 tyrosine-type recombinase/integrase [Pseudomonas sp. CBSPGW29]WEL72037.1 tyrosine-type recombinase/integrase [Pseudomonas sp. CBSPCGW29]WEL78935.1 tyrosine-type recombinase/integrase [Pseudomonas sp. CBSPAW29]WEL82412.1 tyrosine-type recombinase/integrase [Pseudomonas sp. CBSPCAW29]WEL90886.1 tyrosine-type recombinase/integrase [Pseudomonas sp. CBSPCBW29]
MELVWGSKDFVIAGQPYQGFPILLWDSMESCTQANLFFRRYLLRGEIGSKESWPNTGRALYDFFSFLQAHDLDWRDVDRGEAKSLVAAYRDYCLVTCGLARNTIRQRLTYICKFYEFALEKGWVRRLPFGHEERIVPRETSFLEHVDASGGKALVNDVMPRSHKPLPKYLSMSQAKSLLSMAGNPHHRIMIQLALRTGLRRNELATFPVTYVFDPDKAGRTERNLSIRLDPFDGTGMETKGSKKRDIWISRKFMAELYRYVTKLRGERASLGKDQKALLLNHLGESYGSDGKSLNRIIVETGRRAGIEVHTHMLRHTYATYTLVNLQRNPQQGLDPLVFLQRQLGHSSIQTTMIYLHLINEMADEAVLAYDDELNEMAGAV